MPVSHNDGESGYTEGEIGRWRQIEPSEKGHEIARVRDTKALRCVLRREPLTPKEFEAVAQWGAQFMRAVANLKRGKAPGPRRMRVAAALMLCRIYLVDLEDEDEGAAYLSREELGAILSLILVAKGLSGRAYARAVAHELAHLLIRTLIAPELFYAQEVRIDDPNVDVPRLRHLLAERIVEILFEQF